MKALTIIMLALTFTLFSVDVPVADARCGDGSGFLGVRGRVANRVARRYDRRADRQSRISGRMHSRSMHSAPATSNCPTCGRSGIQAVPAPPTTDAPGVSYRIIKKERILNASTW